MEQTIGAVIVSVASIEGLINEILSGPNDRLVDKGNLQNVSDQAYLRWGRLWKDGAFDKQNALEKCQLALSVADLEPLPRDRGAVQDLKLLISLRNEIVHSEPKYRADGKDLPEKDRDKLERSLKSKFEPNQLVPQSAPFIWQRCLGAGCAQWCVETESAFQSPVRSTGISIQNQC